MINCVDFVRQYIYYKHITAHNKEFNDNVLIYIHNNFIEMSVLAWGHLYGNSSDSLHFRKLAENPDDFKLGLLEELSISDKEWITYWNCMKDYRDKGIAHIDPEPILTVPDLEIAYKSIAYYYHYFIDELKMDIKFQAYYDNLHKYADNRFKKYGPQIEKICDLFRKAT